MDGNTHIRASNVNSIASYSNPHGGGVTTDIHGIRYISSPDAYAAAQRNGYLIPPDAHQGGRGYYIADDDGDSLRQRIVQLLRGDRGQR